MNENEDLNIVEEVQDEVVDDPTNDSIPTTAPSSVNSDTVPSGVEFVSEDSEPRTEGYEPSSPEGEGGNSECDQQEASENESTGDVNQENTEEDIDINTLGSMVSTVKDTVDLMAKMWLETAKTYQITDKINRRIADYNEAHRTRPPENLTPEEKEKWDYINGLDQLTLDEAKDIFGEDHPCIQETEEETRKTVKDVFGTFFEYAVQRREYENIRSAYLMYVDDQEVRHIKDLEKERDETEDPELKAHLEKIISEYYRFKQLSFLAEPLSEIHLNRIKTGLVDPKKAEYWLGRTRDKLKQIKINPDFVLMLYHFEEKNLEEKYWKLNNCLLIHFMSLAIYADMHDPRNEKRNMVRCLFVAINAIWSRTIRDEDRIAVMNNIKAFEDQLIDVIEENLEATETIRPL